ncbi:MAG: RnfH family protein [Woeseia sp.]|nr:RnfH family protein [Woeseia sp.]MBT8095402.1 RnfH family protein [Woeseia sp.]NNE61544.1 RnfH family protein [Woeseia sp.]NNL55171.1 RnfH family protein [Woeseia sp.]
MVASGKPQLNVEVVYAALDKQYLVRANVAAGSTVADALVASRLVEEVPKLDLANAEVGIWGRLVDRSAPLQDGDRVEVYRPLQIDPREARRQLAAHGRAMGQKN